LQSNPFVSIKLQKKSIDLKLGLGQVTKSLVMLEN